MQKVSIQVFKMSGERVFVSDSFDTDWDGNDMNGQREFDLSTLNSVVLGSQDALQYVITYHTSQIDADSRNNPLTNPYYNTIPNTEEIFVRIENIDNTDCYATTSTCDTDGEDSISNCVYCSCRIVIAAGCTAAWLPDVREFDARVIGGESFSRYGSKCAD